VEVSSSQTLNGRAVINDSRYIVVLINGVHICVINVQSGQRTVGIRSIRVGSTQVLFENGCSTPSSEEKIGPGREARVLVLRGVGDWRWGAVPIGAI
jgi:hypothetical protein